MKRLLAVDKPPTCAGEWFMPPGPQLADEPCVCDTDFTCIADEHDKGRCDACETPGIYALCCGEHQARMCGTCHTLNHWGP